VLAISLLDSVRTGVLVAAAIGLAHGGGRALALVRDARANDPASYLKSVLRSMYWRTFDGIMLLGLGGMAVLMYAHSLLSHARRLAVRGLPPPGTSA
jgi:hypothetical protein